MERNYLRRRCNLNVLAIEYPGYGIHWDEGICSEERILNDAQTVLGFVTNELKINPDDIMLFGRSMGTGVAA